MAKFRISYNAPVVLTFALAAVTVFIITAEQLAPNVKLWFVAWPEFRDTRSYVGLVSHILGHASWEHLLGNFMLILLIGPIGWAALIFGLPLWVLGTTWFLARRDPAGKAAVPERT